jgi:hypothetical protein
MHVGSSQLVFAYADSEEIGATMAIRLALSDRTSVEEAVYKIAWLRAYGLDSGMLEGLGRSLDIFICLVTCIRSSSSSSWLWCRCKCERSSNLSRRTRLCCFCLRPISSPTLVFSTSLLLTSCWTLVLALYMYL